jgi:hypothetical protein
MKGTYAEEETIGSERTGFILHTLDGQSAYLARLCSLTDVFEHDLTAPYRLAS